MSDVPGFSQSGIEEFLRVSKLPLRLATVDEKGEPSIHPVWYHYEDNKLYFFTGKKSRKAQNITQTGKVYFSIDTEAPPYRGVKGKATAVIIRDIAKSERVAENIVRKYMGSLDNPIGRSLKEDTRSGSDVVIEMTPIYYST